MQLLKREHLAAVDEGGYSEVNKHFAAVEVAGDDAVHEHTAVVEEVEKWVGGGQDYLK